MGKIDLTGKGKPNVVTEEEVKKVFKNKNAIIVTKNRTLEVIKVMRPKDKDHDTERDLTFANIEDLREFIYNALAVLNAWYEQR